MLTIDMIKTVCVMVIVSYVLLLIAVAAHEAAHAAHLIRYGVPGQIIIHLLPYPDGEVVYDNKAYHTVDRRKIRVNIIVANVVSVTIGVLYFILAYMMMRWCDTVLMAGVFLGLIFAGTAVLASVVFNFTLITYDGANFWGVDKIKIKKNK